MATYAVGDIQGCFDTLLQLLERIAFDPAQDRLWLVGDLVNRGPSSLQVLRWMMAHDAAIVSVLGNHDIHLLARHAGVIGPSHDDTLEAILAAPDGDALVDWLARRPLVHYEREHLLLHAGLLPSWSAETAVTLAREAEAELHGPGRKAFLTSLYRERPRRFTADLDPRTRGLVTTAVLTRARTIGDDGQMAPRYKGPPEGAPAGQVAWFLAPGRQSADVTVIFGHWATLGLWIEGRVIALDSGCVWGRMLTAVRLEDRAVFAVQAPL